ncbi:hypothetical protein MMC21_003772 [Puttea exsequens]|nr:hypothetical protein [Puttea exsequens]
MQLRVHRLLATVLALYVGALWARSLNDAPRFAGEERSLEIGDATDSSELEPRNASMLIKRAPDPPPCLVPCAPKPAPTTAQKRSLNPRSVLKRALPDWPATNSKADDKKKDTFMVDGCSALTDAEAIVPDNTQVGTRFGESTAKSVAIAGDSVRLGMQQIHGCTMLYILSRKRAYIGHFWESMSFWRWKDANPDREAAFQTQVIGFLTNGLTANGQVQPGLAPFAADFPPATTFALILSPDTSLDPGAPANVLLYDDQISQMADEIGRILGMPNGGYVEQGTKFKPGSVYRQSYVRVNSGAEGGQDQLDKTAAGRAIFDYDPQAVLGRSRRDPVQAAYRQIWQKAIILLDQWVPGSETQAVPTATPAAAA